MTLYAVVISGKLYSSAGARFESFNGSVSAPVVSPPLPVTLECQRNLHLPTAFQLPPSPARASLVEKHVSSPYYSYGLCLGLWTRCLGNSPSWMLGTFPHDFGRGQRQQAGCIDF